MKRVPRESIENETRTKRINNSSIRDVYRWFKSKCYRIGSICNISYRIFFWINNTHAFGRNAIDSIAFFSQCINFFGEQCVSTRQVCTGLPYLCEFVILINCKQAPACMWVTKCEWLSKREISSKRLKSFLSEGARITRWHCNFYSRDNAIYNESCILCLSQSRDYCMTLLKSIT